MELLDFEEDFRRRRRRWRRIQVRMARMARMAKAVTPRPIPSPVLEDLEALVMFLVFAGPAEETVVEVPESDAGLVIIE